MNTIKELSLEERIAEVRRKQAMVLSVAENVPFINPLDKLRKELPEGLKIPLYEKGEDYPIIFPELFLEIVEGELILKMRIIRDPLEGTSEVYVIEQEHPYEQSSLVGIYGEKGGNYQIIDFSKGSTKVSTFEESNLTNPKARQHVGTHLLHALGHLGKMINANVGKDPFDRVEKNDIVKHSFDCINQSLSTINC